MRLGRIVTNDHICGFQISMDIALGMDALESVHKLKSNDGCGLNREFAFLERLLELLQVDAQKLHDQIVVVLIRAIGV